MIESITIVTISLLLLAYFRPGKTPPLENPLIINRAGKYQITLAPKLNLAQPFIEAVAKEINIAFPATESKAIQFFVVRDRQARSHGSDIYLLSICYRNNMLYFYAENPQPNTPNEYLDVIKAYSVDCMEGFPATDEHTKAIESAITLATQAVAKERGIEVNLLTE